MLGCNDGRLGRVLGWCEQQGPSTCTRRFSREYWLALRPGDHSLDLARMPPPLVTGERRSSPSRRGLGESAIRRTYLHVPVNIKHKGPLAKVGHDVVLLLLEADDGIQLSLDVLEGDVLECNACSLSAVHPDKGGRRLNAPNSRPFLVNSAWFSRKLTRQPTVSPTPNISA